jgi:hypothetical protein
MKTKTIETRQIEIATRNSEREERASAMVPAEIRAKVEEENAKPRPRVVHYDIAKALDKY